MLSGRQALRRLPLGKGRAATDLYVALESGDGSRIYNEVRLPLRPAARGDGSISA